MSLRQVLVIYGSETGNAQDVAEELGRLAERLHFVTRVTTANSVSINELHQYDILLIALSTTGQGEVPPNARAFWKSLLRKKLGPNALDGIRFALFGLGDSSYPKYNWAARKLLKRLEQLGAQTVCLHGEADEQHPEGVDGSFVPWSRTLQETLLNLYPLPPGKSVISSDILIEPKWLLKISPGDRLSALLVQPLSLERREAQIATTVVANDRLTPLEHWQDVRLFKFAADASIQYFPGDTVTIYPKNFSADVEELMKLLGWLDMADTPVEFYPTNGDIPAAMYPPLPVSINGTTTLRYLLTEHLDITAIPKRSFFALLSHFATDPEHKKRLLELADPEYIDDLFDYTTRPRRGILEVVQEFALDVPWQWAAAIVPPLRGRQFSIASGGSLKQWQSEVSSEHQGKTRIDLLVAIVKYKTVMRKIRRGVCTRYMAELKPGTELLISLNKGGLDLKKHHYEQPIVMIGPGTGLAPMRSLIWEKQMLETTSANAAAVLFFGNRNKDSDFFFREEWEKLAHDTALQVITAFSRDQQRKRYVQHAIRDEAELVHSLLCERSGMVFVCGSSGKMPQAVREALIECFEQAGGFSRTDGEAFLLKMEKEGRYKQETW